MPNNKPSFDIKLPAEYHNAPFLSAEETRRILDHTLQHHPGLVPIVATMAFAGVRMAEALELEWSAISIHEGDLMVIGKSCRRAIRISPNLAAWLMPFAQ